jgi:magnesium transporter
VITCRLYRDGHLEEERPYDGAIVDDAERDGGHKLWVDVVDPTEAELAELGSRFSLHPLAVEDSMRWGQRSKAEFFPDHVFLAAHAVDLDASHEIVDREVHVFAGWNRYVITVRRQPLFDFEVARHRLAGEHGLPREGIGFILYLLLDEIVDGYLDTLEELEDLADDVEDRVSDEETVADQVRSQRLAADIFQTRQAVVRFRRLALPMREVVDLLIDTPGIVTPELTPYYRDVLDHVIRATELVDNVRDLLTSARELQLAQVSNRLNVVMKKLTAWAGIILVPTLIAGIYGMNFAHMPELSWTVGYPLALGMMAASALVLYLVFRRRDWL